VALALMCPVASRAWAQDKPSLLVLSIDSDKVNDKQKSSILQAMKTAVGKYEQYTLMDTPAIDLLDEMVTYECIEMDGDCLSAIGGARKAQFVLYSGYDGTTLTVRLVNVGSKAVVGDYSAASAKNKVEDDAAGSAIVKVFGPLPEKPTLVMVTIDANVEAAEVFVNQKRLGTTPLKVKLKPGAYTVSVRKKDFLMVEEKLVVAAAEAMDWKATLKPIPTQVEKPVVVPPVKPPVVGKKDKKEEEGGAAFYETWWFWTAVGVGTAAIVTGTVVAVSAASETSADVGTVRFSISPTAAENDMIFFE
jgi:hypothetical protein